MKKIHNTLWIVLGTCTFLMTLLGLALIKLLPAIEQNIYYCQAFIQSLSVQLFTSHVRLLFFVFLSSISFFIFLKLFVVFYRIHQLKKKIVPYNKYPVHLNKILEKHRLRHSVFFIDTHLSFAFCFGFKSPKIYISKTIIDIMTPKEVEAILLHEKYHMQHNDSMIMTIVSVLQLLFPFLPFVGDLIKNYKLNAEINADMAASSGLNDRSPLVSVLKKMISSSSFSSIAIASIADETLESRIKILLKKEKYTFKLPIKNIIISTLSILMFAGVIVSPNKNEELCIAGTNCSVWCTTGKDSIPDTLIRASYPYSPSH